MQGSPDLKAAKEVADYLGTRHHELYFTVQVIISHNPLILIFFSNEFSIATEKQSFILLYQEGIDALEEVIYHIETYDVTTIRASTPMFLMSRKIKALGVKMVLSGEGSDEIFGGYLYFHKAPNKKEFHEETCRKVMCNNCYVFLFDSFYELNYIFSPFSLYSFYAFLVYSIFSSFDDLTDQSSPSL